MLGHSGHAGVLPAGGHQGGESAPDWREQAQAASQAVMRVVDRIVRKISHNLSWNFYTFAYLPVENYAILLGFGKHLINKKKAGERRMFSKRTFPPAVRIRSGGSITERASPTSRPSRCCLRPSRSSCPCPSM